MRLANKKILITRDKQQASPLVRLLAEFGAEAVCFPTIAITAPEDWQPVDAAIHSIASYDWIIFTSANSVTFFMERVKALKAKPQARIAVVGSKTAAALKTFGFSANLAPPDFTAAGLLDVLKNEQLKGAQILLPASAIARDELNDGLVKLGAQVDRVVVYQNQLHEPANAAEVRQAIHNGEIDLFTFYSPSAIFNFAAIVGQGSLDAIKTQAKPIAVIGPTTAAAARKLGLQNLIEPTTSTTEALVEAMIRFYQTLEIV